MAGIMTILDNDFGNGPRKLNGRVFLPYSLRLLADVRGVAHLEDAIIMLDIFVTLRLWFQLLSFQLP
jgi:hypothetical protein